MPSKPLSITILESAVLYSALVVYKEELGKYLLNPKNKDELTKIKGEIQIVDSLISKTKENHISNGGKESFLD